MHSYDQTGYGTMVPSVGLSSLVVGGISGFIVGFAVAWLVFG